MSDQLSGEYSGKLNLSTALLIIGVFGLFSTIYDHSSWLFTGGRLAHKQYMLQETPYYYDSDDYTGYMLTMHEDFGLFFIGYTGRDLIDKSDNLKQLLLDANPGDPVSVYILQEDESLIGNPLHVIPVYGLSINHQEIFTPEQLKADNIPHLWIWYLVSGSLAAIGIFMKFYKLLNSTPDNDG